MTKTNKWRREILVKKSIHKNYEDQQVRLLKKRTLAFNWENTVLSIPLISTVNYRLISEVLRILKDANGGG